jgi:hypothetical protein
MPGSDSERDLELCDAGDAERMAASYFRFTLVFGDAVHL